MIPRLSQLGSCPRKFSYRLRTPLPDDYKEEYNSLFADGNWHEFEVKYRLQKLGVIFEAGYPSVVEVVNTINGEVSTGHLDGIVQVLGGGSIILGGQHLPHGRYILEVKSMNSGSWWQMRKKGLKESHPSYWAQIQGYLFSQMMGIIDNVNLPVGKDPIDEIVNIMADVQKFFTEPVFSLSYMPLKALEVSKNKDTGQLQWEVVYPDPIYMDEISDRWRDATLQHDQGGLPDRLYDNEDNWECRDCAFREECWGTEVDNTVVNLDDPMLVDAATQFIEGKKLASKAEDIMDKARPVLEAVPLDKFVVGDLVSVSKSDRAYTNWQAVARAYNPEASMIQENTETSKVVTVRVKAQKEKEINGD